MSPFALSGVSRALIVAGLSCLLSAGCGGSSTSSSPSTAKSAKANFEKVKEGMTEKDVTDIMGAATASVEMDPKKMQSMMKDLMKSVPIPELPGGIGLPEMPIPKFTVKTWEEGDTMFQVVIQEGKVVSKAAETKKAKVTKENANKITVGMTKAEVEAILGKGKVSAGADAGGVGAETVLWEGDGAITVIFLNDKVTVAAVFKAK